MVKKNRSKNRVIDAEKAVEVYNQAVFFHQNNQLHESESAYRVALKLNPDFAEAHNNLGNVLKGRSCFYCHKPLSCGVLWAIFRINTDSF